MTNSFLELYFKRIHYTQTPRVNLKTLRDLHLLHLQHIPYENLSVFSHQPVTLDQESLIQKMLLRQRGGYCFEQNGLFLMVLAELGFKCHANMARVHRNRPHPGARTHQINVVEVEGQSWICDVGFGGSGFRYPLLSQLEIEVEQMGEIYRLHGDATHGIYLQKKVTQDWEPLYTFKPDPAMPIDLEMANFYTSNSPQYVFRNAILGTRMTPRGRVTLSDHTFKRFDLIECTLQKETVTDFAAYVIKLQELLGVYLNDSEKALLAVRFATLKPSER